LSASSAYALDPHRKINEYMIDFWQEDSGLPQKTVDVIHQTRDGYLWLGTRGGLARFDGVRFTTFDERRPGQLREGEVRALAEDLDGGLWIGTYGGGVSHLVRGVFTTYGTAEGLPSDFVRAVACGTDGSIWVATDTALARRRRGATTFSVVKGLPSERLLRVLPSSDGGMWVGTYNGLAWVSADGRVVDYAARHAELKDNIWGIVDDGDGGLWLTTAGHGLVHFKDRVLSTLGEAEGLDSKHVVGACIDLQGTLWFATATQLYRYRDGRPEPYLAQFAAVGANRTMRVSMLRKITTVFADREGSVWVGTGFDGMARLRDAVFSTVSSGLDDEGRDRRVSTVFADSHGAVWMGVFGGGLARVQDGVMTHVEGPPQFTVDTLVEDDKGALWVENEARYWRLESGRLVEIPLKGLAPEEVARLTIATSLKARDGTLWLGHRARGLLRYRDGAFTLYDKAAGLPGLHTRALAEDGRGGIWVGTRDGGLYCLRDGKVETTYSADRGLPSSGVSAVYVDKDDVLWVATRRGLVRIRGRRSRVFGADEGLPAGHFYQIVEDDLGYLWMTHGRGIVRVSRQGLNDVADGRATAVDVRTFGTESGMKSTAMVLPGQPAVTKGRDGRLWFATAEGAAVVDPAAIVVNRVPPPVWVESIRIDKQAHAPAGGMHFPPGRGDVEISYVGLSFVAPERVRFKYMLEGFDTGWVDADTRRVAYYTNLPPASYRFRVRACNNDGVWNETGHALVFQLLPHWYQRRSVHAAGLVLLGALAVAAYRWRVQGHKRRAVELAAKVEEAVGQLKTLRGMLPICAGCKKIRDDSGYWNQMETYISKHSDADFSHGMCPDCLVRMYPDYAATLPRGQ
jgi:ligand-binding sensor domain-containing protein